MGLIKTDTDVEDAYARGEISMDRALILQSALGSRDDAEGAFDEDNRFHCIDFWDCQCCPVASECFMNDGR